MFEFYFADQLVKQNSSAWQFLDKLFPILTLVFGIALGRILLFYDQRSKYKKITTDVFTELQGLSPFVNAQQQAIQDLRNLLANRTYEDFRITIVNALNLDRFQGLDRIALVEHLARKSSSRKISIERVNRILTHCSILSGNHHNLRNAIDDLVEETENCHAKWVTIIRDIRINAVQVLRDIERTGIPIEQDAPGREINGIVNLVLRANQPPSNPQVKDLFEELDTFVEPLFRVCATHRLDSRLDPLMLQCTLAYAESHSIVRAKNKASARLKHIGERISITAEILKKESSTVFPKKL